MVKVTFQYWITDLYQEDEEVKDDKSIIWLSKIKATIIKKDRRKKVSPLALAHKAEKYLHSVVVPGPYISNSTDPLLDELPDKCVINIVRRIIGFSPFPS